MDKKGLTIAGWVVTILGVGLNIVSQILGDKQQEVLIDEAVTKKVAEGFAKMNEGKS